MPGHSTFHNFYGRNFMSFSSWVFFAYFLYQVLLTMKSVKFCYFLHGVLIIGLFYFLNSAPPPSLPTSIQLLFALWYFHFLDDLQIICQVISCSCFPVFSPLVNSSLCLCVLNNAFGPMLYYTISIECCLFRDQPSGRNV